MPSLIQCLLKGIRNCCRPNSATLSQTIRGEANQVELHDPEVINVSITISGNRNRLVVEPDCVLKNVTITITGDGHVCRIGRGCIFEHGADLCMEDRDGHVEIGEQCYFQEIRLATAEPGSSIQIGKDCLFAYDIDIRCSDAHSILDGDSGRRINPAQDVRIAEHVWVAAHCIILKGVSIATNSVVAAGSVVTKSFEDDGIVIAGNPARVIKQNITWDAKRIYDRDSP